MPSKMVVRRQKNNAAVQAAIVAHSAEALAGLRGSLDAFLEDGETFPDLGLFQELCRRSLEAHRRRLVRRDDEHLNRLSQRVDPLRRRREAARALGRALAQCRETSRGLFGRAAADALLGLGGAMGSDPEELIRKARRMLGVLARNDLELPPPILRGITVDTTAWSEDLQPLLDELEASHQAMVHQRRREESTLVAKHETLATHDVAYRRVTKALQSLYELGDQTALARKLRPNPLKVSRTQEVPKTQDRIHPDPGAAPPTGVPEPLPPPPLEPDRTGSPRATDWPPAA